jgi:hypothetical protein
LSWEIQKFATFLLVDDNTQQNNDCLEFGKDSVVVLVVVEINLQLLLLWLLIKTIIRMNNEFVKTKKKNKKINKWWVMQWIS